MSDSIERDAACSQEAPATAAETSSGETWSEPNVPMPMQGICSPLFSVRFGTRRGSICSIF